MDQEVVVNSVYVVSAALFIFGLKQQSKPSTARLGNGLSALGMLIAVLATLLSDQVITLQWAFIAMVLGTVVGAGVARMIAMTSMPEMVALLNGSGGLASLLVGYAALFTEVPLGERVVVPFVAVTVMFSVLIGAVTFSGSLIAWGKLNETLIPTRALVFGGQRALNALLLLCLLVAASLFVLHPSPDSAPYFALIGLSLLLGVMVVIPIGGADMPVVVALLNSYSGLAACAAGFAIGNNILIVAGALVGAAGLILTSIMCKAMNRSLVNVFFSGFGAVKKATRVEGEVKPITADDAFLILEAAATVVFVPGYGMAAAQAQHVVRELGDLLEQNNCEVSYAIHPVAGRMPGHMNVLLAEANVPYEQLIEMDDINPRMEQMDVAVVIGANDVVNPAARSDEQSPIYGMPVINVDSARTVFVLKRSMSAGFSGVDNPLFVGDNTRMLFGDAKSSIAGIVAEFKR